MNELIRNIVQKYGQKFVIEVVNQLNAAGKGGNVANSVNFNVESESDRVSFQLIADESFKFINEGRKPGSKQPPTSALTEWAVNKGIEPTEGNLYVIARAIGINGIQPSNILDKAMSKMPDIQDNIQYEVSEYIKNQLVNYGI